MGQVIRVMLADDSSIVRRLMTQVISANPRCQLVYSAKNGQEAVDNFKSVAPDLVLLDVEMPVLDGIEAVKQLKALDADLPIIMCSSLTSRGGQATIEALANGANDYITKPAGVGHVNEALAQLERELMPKIILWGDRRLSRRAAKAAIAGKQVTPAKITPQSAASLGPIGIVAVGVSTGGPNALAEFLPGLAEQLSVPMVIAQHMPPTFTKLLAERLTATSHLNV
ncbi:MAG: response regulator, partial [Planctomycetales bacterium]|nr:response regulator [Planctomycetales bacterium]